MTNKFGRIHERHADCISPSRTANSSNISVEKFSQANKIWMQIANSYQQLNRTRQGQKSDVVFFSLGLSVINFCSVEKHTHKFLWHFCGLERHGYYKVYNCAFFEKDLFIRKNCGLSNSMIFFLWKICFLSKDNNTLKAHTCPRFVLIFLDLHTTQNSLELASVPFSWFWFKVHFALISLCMHSWKWSDMFMLICNDNRMKCWCVFLFT